VLSGSGSTTRILGGEELVGEAQHYWEVKMTRPVYGTDVMIGLTTQASPTEIHFTKIIYSGRSMKFWYKKLFACYGTF
jgi:SPRY domain-containing SOCS box protein 3